MRGISELLSVVILIAVVVSGSLVFTNLSQQRIFTNTQSISEALDNSKDQTSELIQKISMLKTQNSGNVFLINYGPNDILIKQAYVDTMFNPTSVTVSSIDDQILYGNIIPALDTQSTVNLQTDKPYQDKIILITDSGNTYVFTP